MSRQNPERTVAVKLSGQPKSSAYAAVNRCPQALPAKSLGANGVEQWPSMQKSFWAVETQQEVTDDVPQWYLLNPPLLERHFDFEESVNVCAAGLKLSNEDAQTVVDQVPIVFSQKIGLKFKQAAGSNVKYPRPPKEHSARILAQKIASNLDRVAQKNSTLVKQGIQTYANNVHKSNRVVLTSDAQAPGVRKWMKLVRKLQVKELSFQITGFMVNEEKGDLKQKLKLLGLSLATPIHWVNAPNQNSRASLNHIAIDIVCGLDRKNGSVVISSEAFRYAMAIAAISQIWLSSNTEMLERQPPPPTTEPMGDQMGVQVSLFG